MHTLLKVDINNTVQHTVLFIYILYAWDILQCISYTLYFLCTVCVRCVYGVCTVCVRCVYCICTVYVRCMYGVCTVCVRCVYGVCTVCVLCAYDVCTVCVRCVYDVCTVVCEYVTGIPTLTNHRTMQIQCNCYTVVHVGSMYVLV